jgi:hypothetical protein
LKSIAEISFKVKNAPEKGLFRPFWTFLAGRLCRPFQIFWSPNMVLGPPRSRHHAATGSEVTRRKQNKVVPHAVQQQL